MSLPGRTPVGLIVGAPTQESTMATVRYLVADVDAALPFYQALGFTITERWGPPFVMLAREDLSLWLSGPGTSASRPLSDGSVPKPGGWNRLVIEVEDLASSMSALRETGARFRSDPVQGPGGRQVLVEDPSGNPVELFEAKDE
jgi:catechol 2,3-dioxygenase-like lactoylglutathione lyase family enzyme